MIDRYKFRGKSIETGEWVYGSLNTHYDSGNGSVTIWGEYNDFEDVDPSSVGQFSGLTDKTGQEIYENDVVKWIDSDRKVRIDTVQWKNGGLILCNQQYAVGVYLFNGLEVIGNIHDNKELIEHFK